MARKKKNAHMLKILPEMLRCFQNSKKFIISLQAGSLLLVISM